MASGIKAYPFDEIEPKWQSYWEKNKTFRAPAPGEKGSEKPKYYVLDMFPYPSASGLHVGHLEGYTATDIISRYKRMKGFNVLHPMGWDAFGLPAEQHAIESGTHPREATAKNVANFKRQIQCMGFSYDWQREVNTTDPNYFKWTQWIFRKLYEKDLAYEAEMAVNWCPALKAVLANEEVIDGKSERGNHPVIRKPMRQWVMRITRYAERLLQDLDALDWPEAIKDQQRNWIGKSTGAEVDFKTAGGDVIRVYTTRPDTLFGATYMVLAPEHKLVAKIASAEQKQAVDAYIEAATRKSDLSRTDLNEEKTGVFTGAYAINPVNGKQIPIWIADYVLISYGTGAIMAVPAHDERDHEFAVKYKLPIIPVVHSSGTKLFNEVSDKAPQDFPFTDAGISFNSTTPDGSFSIDGMTSDKAKEKITVWLEQKSIGKKSVQYKLRDWIFSRQRYWGEPIPVIHCLNCNEVLIPENELPLELPEMFSFKPTDDGNPPLANAPAEWYHPKCPKCGKDKTEAGVRSTYRETNTMPQWAGSCWYYLRYADPDNDKLPIDLDKEKYWLPVDLYVGGAEHAVLHLLYSRFWHKVLYDCGVVSTKEPFHKLVNQGMILGDDNQKMSKSRGNVINPDEVVENFGADSIRLYEMFMGPLEMTKPWSTNGLEGIYRFLGRVWRLFMTAENQLVPGITERAANPQELKRLHHVIKKVTDDLENIRLNTAISALMIFVNETTKDENRSKEMLEKFLLILAPFAPHMAEELWEKLGHKTTLAYELWPTYEAKYLEEDEFEMAVLIGGKVRTKLMISKGLSDDQVRSLALADEKVKPWVEGREIVKVIVVPGRTINIVAK